MTALVAALMLSVAIWLLTRPVPRRLLEPAVRGRRQRGQEASGPGPGGAGARMRARWSPRRRAAAHDLEAEILDLLDALAPALRAGLPPVAAVRLVTASRSDGGPLERLEEAAASGEPLGPVWTAYAGSVGSDDLRLVAGTWSLCDELGAPLAPTVSTVSGVVRRRRAVRTRIATALAGPQATMRVLTALPLSGPVVAVLVGVSPAELYAQPAGAGSLIAGLALLLVGRWWAGRLVHAVRDERPAHPRQARRRPARVRAPRSRRGRSSGRGS